MNKLSIIIGKNGSGKTTYLNKLYQNSNIKNSFFFQDQLNLQLNPYIKLFDYLEILKNRKIKIPNFLLNLNNIFIRELSLGQIKMIALLFLEIGFENYFLDEPFSNLDFVSQNWLIEILNELEKKESVQHIYLTMHDFKFKKNIFSNYQLILIDNYQLKNLDKNEETYF